MAISTGALVFGEDATEVKLEQVSLSDLGQVGLFIHPKLLNSTSINGNVLTFR